MKILSRVSTGSVQTGHYERIVTLENGKIFDTENGVKEELIFSNHSNEEVVALYEKYHLRYVRKLATKKVKV